MIKCVWGKRVEEIDLWRIEKKLKKKEREREEVL